MGPAAAGEVFKELPSALAEAGRAGWERLPALCLLALLQLRELRNLFGPSCSPAPEAVGLLELTSSMSVAALVPKRLSRK